MSLPADEKKAVREAVIERLGSRDRRNRAGAWWAAMIHETGWVHLEPALSLAGWHDFLRLCGEVCAPRDAEEQHFRSLIRLIARHGDDDHGDRPADMTRIVYWFQHLHVSDDSSGALPLAAPLSERPAWFSRWPRSKMWVAQRQ